MKMRRSTALVALLAAAARPAEARESVEKIQRLAGVDKTSFGLPMWPATYNAQQSTAFMPCNYSGFFNASFAATFGVADFDWSNAKAHWANEQPMTCEEDLVTQAEAVHAVNPNMRVFVYRNLVKALPWFTAVREKIMDPAYSGWFLRFSGANNYHVPTCDNNWTPPRCSEFYHDQDQVSTITLIRTTNSYPRPPTSNLWQSSCALGDLPRPSADARTPARRRQLREPVRLRRGRTVRRIASRRPVRQRPAAHKLTTFRLPLIPPAASGTTPTVRCCATGSSTSTCSARRALATRRCTVFM